jgi:flagella basal body P-ring formation protein FlgA
MNQKLMILVLGLGCVMSPLTLAQVNPGQTNDSDDGFSLQIHLPREITVRDSFLYLGQVTVVRGSGTTVDQARELGMGRFSAPGQRVVLDRATILSRLASLGIPTEKVRLTGADAVTVCRLQEIVDSDDFINTGEEFIRQHTGGLAVSEIIALSRPKSLVLAGQPKDVQLKPQFVRSPTSGLVTVQMQVLVDGKNVDTRSVPYRLRYKCRQAVAVTDIAQGIPLTTDNIRIETRVSDRPEPAGWKPPYGLLATRGLKANSLIRDDMLATAQSGVVVRRNETVMIRLERPGFTVTAVGTALQKAQAGETIKVRNDDSRRVIDCKVNADGTVEPILYL